MPGWNSKQKGKGMRGGFGNIVLDRIEKRSMMRIEMKIKEKQC